MNDPAQPNPLRIQQQHKTEAEQELRQENVAQSAATQEFAEVEELLRHDALHTPVPPRIEMRLRESLGTVVSASPRPWWRRILGW